MYVSQEFLIVARVTNSADTAFGAVSTFISFSRSVPIRRLLNHDGLPVIAHITDSIVSVFLLLITPQIHILIYEYVVRCQR